MHCSRILADFLPPRIHTPVVCATIGAAADEKQMIAAHFLVFLLAAYQHRVHVALGDTPAARYRPVSISAAMKDAWRPMTYDSVNQWTWLDHVRFWFYR